MYHDRCYLNLCLMHYNRFIAVVKLQVEEAESNITVPEDGSSPAGLQHSVSVLERFPLLCVWYVYRLGQEQEEEEEQECVFSIGHDAVFGNGNCSPTEEPGPNFPPAVWTHHLWPVQLNHPESSVQRCRGITTAMWRMWLLNPRKAWYRLATNNSGVTVVMLWSRVSFCTLWALTTFHVYFTGPNQTQCNKVVYLPTLNCENVP